MVMDVFSKAKAIYVRDVFAQKQFKGVGIDAELIPDIVLSEWKKASNTSEIEKGITIGIILTNKNKAFRSKILIALKQFFAKHHCKGCVKVLLSRRWKQDFLTNLAIQAELEELGLDSELVIPGNFPSLEKNLSKCHVVISENLHGMILSTRNGVPFVAINNYPKGSPNYTKIVSFVTQVESESFVINDKVNSEDVFNMIFTAHDSREKFKVKAKELCEITEKQSKDFLTEVFR